MWHEETATASASERHNPLVPRHRDWRRHLHQWIGFVTGLALPLTVVALESEPSYPATNDPPAVPADRTAIEASVSELLVDTPFINQLLVDREFPVIGGRWGGDLFVDIPLNDEPAGAEVTLRRAKLSYARRLTEHWRLKLTADYTRNGGLELSDNYLSWSGWDRARVTVGITDPPFSLESVSSSSGITFLERALPVAALSERKSGGVNILGRTPRGILNGTLVLFNLTRDDLREEGEGVVLHYAHSPIEPASGHQLNIGLSLSYRWNATEEGTRFRSRPEIATVDDFFVDTGEIAEADRIGRLSLEASAVRGRFSWQSELLGARVERPGSVSLEFWGAYVFASWFFTEDQRNYHLGDGSYGWVRVSDPLLEGGWGAFEVAARASVVDLNDQDILGGREHNLSLGLNWYLNDQVRVMVNAIKVLDVERPGSEFDGENPLILGLRLQYALH
jgi:phosphate-selective porin OprO/OprP